MSQLKHPPGGPAPAVPDIDASPGPVPRLQRLLRALPFVWLALAALGIWRFARVEAQPPVFDALSYVQKAQAFWAAVGQGRAFDPLALDPPVRPFGTVFFTHPFGFTGDFRYFYFLTAFLPAALLVVAVLVAAGRDTARRPAATWVLSIAAVVVASIPAHFQFDPGTGLAVMGTWGFVDTLLGALGALGCAFALASGRSNPTRNTVLAVLSAIACILVKPAGLAMMGIIAGSWGLVHLEALHSRRTSLRAVLPLAGFLMLSYGLTALWLKGSPYFSEENYRYGISSMKLLHAEQTAFPGIGLIWEKLRISVGIPLVVLLVLGIACALVQRRWHLVLLAVGVLGAGVWLWLVRTNVDHVRYFFPYPPMALMFLVGPLLEQTRAWGKTMAAPMTLLLVPTLGIAWALLGPPASPALQSRLGINLATNLHVDAVEQGRKLVAALAREPARKSIVYYCTGSTAVLAFEGVMDWHRLLGLPGGNSIPSLPVNWVDEHAYRLDHMIRARYVVFEPVPDPAAISARYPVVKTFDEEQLLIRAWLTGLGESDGVRIASNGEVRVLEVDNRGALTESSKRLMASRNWRKVFVDGFNPLQTVSAAEVAALPGNLLAEPVALTWKGLRVAEVAAVTRSGDAGGTTKVRLHVRQLAPLPASAGEGWTVFVHDLDDADAMIDSYVPYLADTSSGDGYVVYDLEVRARTHGQSRALGFGVFRADPAGNQSLLNPAGEWDGARTRVPLTGQSR